MAIKLSQSFSSGYCWVPLLLTSAGSNYRNAASAFGRPSPLRWTRRLAGIPNHIRGRTTAEMISTEANHEPGGSNRSDHLDPSIDPTVWTVCDSCHGEGRLARRRVSKKARYKQQQSPLQLPLPQLMDVCQSCRGSGLQVAYPLLEDPLTPSLPKKQQRAIVPLKVAIIGGGIAGLALAAALQHRRPYFSVRLYERDVQFDQRQQGYGLTLQQAALQLTALGLAVPLTAGVTSTKHIVHDTVGNVVGTWGMRHWTTNTTEDDATHASLRTCLTPDTSTPLTNATDTVPLLDTKRRKRQNVHIARQALRYELFRAATVHERQHRTSDTDTKDSMIRWGHRLVDYDETEDAVALTFDVTNDPNQRDSTSRTVVERADLVVGADGIRSRVRQQLVPSTDHGIGTTLAPPPLRYLDCMVILGICPLTLVTDTGITPSFAHLLDGETVFQTADGVTRMYMMPYSSTEYMWQLSFPISEQEASSLSVQGSAALQSEALRRCGTWHAPIPSVLALTPVDLVSGYPVYDHPILRADDIPTRSGPRRVTCVGDSIHCMSPFKGQGANQALLDALSLARALYRTVRLKLARVRNDPADTTPVPVEAHEIEAALLEYEAEMLQRSAVKVNASAQAAHFLHTPIAIQVGNVTRGAAAAAASTTNALALDSSDVE